MVFEKEITGRRQNRKKIDQKIKNKTEKVCKQKQKEIE